MPIPTSTLRKTIQLLTKLCFTKCYVATTFLLTPLLRLPGNLVFVVHKLALESVNLTNALKFVYILDFNLFHLIYFDDITQEASVRLKTIAACLAAARKSKKKYKALPSCRLLRIQNKKQKNCQSPLWESH